VSIEELETSLLAQLPVAGLTTKMPFMERILERLSQLLDFVGELPKQEILDMLADLYDDYIAPLDIPGVPNIILEAKLDEMLKKVFLAIAERIIDRVNS